jgi:hypothetical protein
VLETIQSSWLARAIGESQVALASLSAVHLVGFTAAMGGAVVSSLRLLGAMFRDVPSIEVAGPAVRVVKAGLLVSVLTGALLFAPRAASAASNPTFRTKLLLLLLATMVQFLIHERTARSRSVVAARLVGGIGLALWVGVALAGCAFILLE